MSENSIIQALLQTLRERDNYTYNHSIRVSRLARLLAQAAGLSQDHQQIIETSALLHDLGKIGIPDQILLKPAKLTPEEQECMRLHPKKGIEILKHLSDFPLFQAIIPGILCHHERIDGLGYPFGLKEEEIPIDARIILIADTFDAVTTTRPYRQALPVDVAFQELHKHSGVQFDAELVRVFIEAFPSSEEIKKAA